LNIPVQGLRSNAQRKASQLYFAKRRQVMGQQQHRKAVGKRLQLPTNKQQLREVLDQAVAEYHKRQRD
jgi:hypothetical protein